MAKADLSELLRSLAPERDWHPTGDELSRLCERARELAGVSPSDDAIVRGLAANPNIEAAPSVDGLVEVALAAACAEGDDRAHRRVADEYLSVAGEALSHMKLPAAQADDIAQMVMEKLLVPPAGGGPIALATYAGRGRLRGLVKVVAVRTALSELRKGGKTAAMPDAGPDIFEDSPATVDPELAFVKKRYRAEFKVAFERAITELSERERNLLRLHLLRGVTLHALAEMYNVHRATVVRWLAAARERVMSSTRQHLGQQLDIAASQMDTVMKWIGGRLDASVSRVLRTRSEASGE